MDEKITKFLDGGVLSINKSDLAKVDITAGSALTESPVIITKKQFQIQIGDFNYYRCANCDGKSIKEDYRFCPFCGKELVFNILEK